MSRATYAYALVLLPPRDLYRQFLALRRKHPLLRSTSPPHITVKPPFFYRATGALVLEKLEEILVHHVPFAVRLNGLGSFGTSVLHVRVEESPELTALHGALVEGLTGLIETISERYEGNGYTPHLTLAEKLTPDDFIVAKKALADFWPRRRFIADTLHLLRGHDKWDITRSFRLGPPG